MTKIFTGWTSVNLNNLDRLVVDGDSVYSQLYHQQHQHQCIGVDCLLQYHSSVREFFVEILFTKVQVTVIFRGIDHEGKRLEATRKRNTQLNESMRQMQGRIGWASGTDKLIITPPLVLSVFKDILRDLSIQFLVADTDTGAEVAALANHYKCPVLAADAEFFMFDLQYGYIPLDKLSTIIANGLMYNVSNFQRQFWLSDSKLRLVIPAMFGNGLLKQLAKSNLDNDFESALKGAAVCDSCEDFLASEPNEETRENFKLATDFYCGMKLPAYHQEQNHATSEIFTVPEYIIQSFRVGNLEPQLLNASFNGTYVLGLCIEDIKRDSAWLASRSIRQHLYGLIGKPTHTKVIEVIRAKSSPEVIDVQVSPSTLDVSPASATDADLALLVHRVLSFDRMLSDKDISEEYGSLKSEWKLPIAATFYWYQTCDNPSVQRHLVKSLLLSFLTCSGIVKLEVPPLEKVTRESKPDYMNALHTFAQWQCIYHDAMSLNYLAKEPFPTTSPSLLFSGRVAFFYASFACKNMSIDSVLCHGTEEWSLYNKFLYLVTGRDQEGRVGDHAKHKARKTCTVVRETATAVVHDNPFALLPDKEDS